MRTTNTRWPLVTVAALVLGTLGPAVASAQTAVAAPLSTAVPATGVQSPDRIQEGERLLAGQQLVSQNGEYRLVLTTSGVAEIRIRLPCTTSSTPTEVPYEPWTIASGS